MGNSGHISLLINNQEKTFYNSVRENLLHNFLEKYYKFTVVSAIDCLISDIRMRCPFNVEFEKETNNLNILLDDTQKLTYLLVFENHKNSIITLHCLKNII